MRLFVSIDFPPEIIDYFVSIQEHIKTEKLFEGHFVNPNLLHLTLQFIDEVSEKQLSSIQEALNKVIIQQLELCLGSLGFFEKHGHPMIVWIDIKGAFLFELAEQIHNFLMPLVELEKRNFISHVTLARIKKIYDLQKFMNFVVDFKVEPHSFLVDTFSLKESVLTKEGREHTVIARYSLQK